MKILSVSEMYTKLKNAGARADRNNLMSEMNELLDPKIKKAFNQRVSGIKFEMGDNLYKTDNYTGTLGGRIMKSLGFEQGEKYITEKRSVYHPQEEKFGLMSSTYDNKGKLVNRQLPDGTVIEVDYGDVSPITRKYQTTDNGVELMTEIQKGMPKAYFTRYGNTVYELQTLHHLPDSNTGSVELLYRIPRADTLYASRGSFECIMPQRNILNLKNGKIYTLEFDSKMNPILIYQKSAQSPEKIYEGYDEISAVLKKMPEQTRNDLLVNLPGVF